MPWNSALSTDLDRLSKKTLYLLACSLGVNHSECVEKWRLIADISKILDNATL